MLSYLLFSRKKRSKTVIIVKNRISPPGLIRKGGLFRKIAYTPGGLIERGGGGGYSKLGAYSIIHIGKFSTAVWLGLDIKLSP